MIGSGVKCEYKAVVGGETRRKTQALAGGIGPEQYLTILEKELRV